MTSTSYGRSCSGRISLLALVAALSLLPAESISAPSLAATACSSTLYPSLCLTTLLPSPGATARDLVHISLNTTVYRLTRALYGASAIAATPMHPLARAAYDDCMELLSDSLDQLTQSISSLSLSHPSATDDIITWLSAALTNHDTCSDGLSGVDPDAQVRTQMEVHLKDLAEMVSNCLAIFTAATRSQDFAGVPIQNRRRRLMGFPDWVRKGDRRLLQLSVAGMNVDMVVDKDGNGSSYKTIVDAVKAAPEYSGRRIVIYVKAGRYDENVKVGRKKTNLMFVGDGKGMTIVGGSRSVADNFTTFHTATFAATGAGFIMRDMTINNWAGPTKHQAVALRVGGDHAVVYRCNIIGYQDSLYVHSQRQFFRECDVYGTVDFIFGNAAVVIQNSTLWSRTPLPMQKITITAQNRKDPNQNTGISIHACRVIATPELEGALTKESYPTYLGRPWKLYSRVVYMRTYIGGHVDPAGWLEWNATFALNTLYYGEYTNYGPGSGLGMRVTWPGYKVITSPAEASKFTVGEFIAGSMWLPSTGVAFLAGLSP